MIDKFAKIARFNFWDQTPYLGVIRKEYVEKLLDYKDTNLVKVLVGQRRVGKSFVLRQYTQKLIEMGVDPKNTIYINKEFVEFDFIITYIDLVHFINEYIQSRKIQNHPLYVFIDEVQLINTWEKAINALSQDYTQQINICITGSNSEMLSGELSTLLSGRFVTIPIFPFDFEEYRFVYKKEKTRASFLEFMQSGGLPELMNLSTLETKQFYLTSLQNTIILRDIVQRYKVKDTVLLLDVFAYLVNNFSTLFSVNNLVNYFKSNNRKTNYETIANYIEYLTNTFVIHKCERVNLKGKEVVAGTSKYYVNDLSFKNYLFSGNTHGMGYMLENLVFITLKQKGYLVYVGMTRDSEVDFIATKKDRTIYIQVTFSLEDEQTAVREYKALTSIKDNYEKWIVSLDEIPRGNLNGIKNILAWELYDCL
jgi:predicted AAA+ superfamily ATPase